MPHLPTASRKSVRRLENAAEELAPKSIRYCTHFAISPDRKHLLLIKHDG
jgi:hypothetical protein